MGKTADIRMLALDMDGTLVNSMKNIDPVDLQAVKDAADAVTLSNDECGVAAAIGKYIL